MIYVLEVCPLTNTPKSSRVVVPVLNSWLTAKLNLWTIMITRMAAREG